MKIVILGLFLQLFLFGNEGKELFDKHCLSCHISYIPMEKLKENFLDADNKILNLKAPTLNQLSYRLKQRIGDPKGDNDMHRMEVTAFMSDYVIHPERDKSVCLDDVMEYFETMPSLKGTIDDDALEKIGTYLYDFDQNLTSETDIKYVGFDEALTQAKSEHKIIMIKVMSEGCHFCRKMDKTTMKDREVVDMVNQDFITVTVDISKSMLPLGLKAEVTPTFIFVDENANTLLHIPGAWGVTDFAEILKEAKNKNLKQIKAKK